MKRVFDIIFSLLGLIILSPLFIVMAIIIPVTSSGGIFFRGVRVGQYGKPFKIYKFRSMVKDAEGKGKWNVGDTDERITPIGHFLRNSKIDEIPQLINVLIGNMSFVGPRPELQYYVDMYTEEEKRILDSKPGITDWASITNFNQFEVFTRTSDPDEAYLKYIRPLKLKLQLYYRENKSFFNDIYIITWSIHKVISRTPKLPNKISHIVDAYKYKDKLGINNELLIPNKSGASEQLAWKIRRHGIEMTHLSGGAHIGSILSVADIIAVLYSDIANVDSANPQMPERDRIILSKGHAGAAIYAALAEKGFFDVEELKTHYADGSRLSGHVSHKGVPGVEFSTGSLGHGLSVAAGMAYGAKKDNKQYNIFAICGDGECDEGAVWEAALVANQFKLNNLIAIIDHNKMQSLDFCENTIALSPFANKWKAFGWNVLDINGHDHDALRDAFIKAKESKDKPTVIIANTIKGKGISFMENNILWHYRYPHDGKEYDSALEELRAKKPERIIDIYEVTKCDDEVVSERELEIQK